MTASREHFGSRLGFVLAAAGSAVGIGNLVGFPVAATKNGGGAFLLIYAIFVVAICIPVMMAELSLGRRTDKDPVGAYKALGGGFWNIAGWLSFITPFMIAVFYVVITIWISGYLFGAATGDLRLLATDGYFGEFINSNDIFIHFVIVSLVVNGILLGGVKGGIERAAKLMMPTLFALLVGLTIYVLTLPNAIEGVKYYLIPDFAKITASTLSGALSQAFFSLSLGMGIMITYGSYMQRSESIYSNSKLIALTDTSVAFFAGLMILPAIFSFAPDINTSELTESSVSLSFNYLPKIFLALEGSAGYLGASIVATVFFTLVFFAAITSLVSIMEVPVSSFMDNFCMSRRKALLLLLATQGVIAIACAVSFGMVDSLTQFVSYSGAPKSLFDVVYDVFYDTILPLNGFLICIFVIYKWKKQNFHAELGVGDGDSFNHSKMAKYVDFSLGTFIPAILFVIFVNTVALKFFGGSILPF